MGASLLMCALRLAHTPLPHQRDLCQVVIIMFFSRAKLVVFISTLGILFGEQGDSLGSFHFMNFQCIQGLNAFLRLSGWLFVNPQHAN